jgi:hypothetical protein
MDHQQQVDQPAPQVIAGRRRDLHPVATDALAHGRREQRIAGGEVAEDRAPVDLGRRGDVVDGRGQAPLGQH